MGLEERRHGGVDAVVNPSHVNGEQAVPFILRHLGQKSKVHRPGVADKNVHVPDLRKSPVHGFPVRHVAANGGGSCFVRHSFRGGMVFLVQKRHPVAPCGEQPDRSRADPPGTAGDHNIPHRISRLPQSISVS